MEVWSRVPEAFTISLLIVVALAVLFDYINGFHDTANAIATSVATRALRPKVAVLMAAAFNFIGAFAGTAVAKTIGSGLVDDATTTQAIVAAALIGAITWNLITWWYSLPSSSSHALIGGLLGATVIAAGVGALNIQGIVNKVLIPMVTSPVLGFVGALLLMVVLAWLFRNTVRKPMAHRFRKLQVGSAAFMAFAHGSNDAQKTMGIITLALFSAGAIPSVEVPAWVIVVSATALSLGTAVGGWRIDEDDGPAGGRARAGPRIRSGDDGSDRAPGNGHPGDASLHDPRHLERHHGRRHQPGHPARPLGRGTQHPRGVGADHPRSCLHRSRRVAHHP